MHTTSPCSRFVRIMPCIGHRTLLIAYLDKVIIVAKAAAGFLVIYVQD